MSHVAWQDIKISPCGKFHTLNNSPIYLFLFNQVMKYHSPGLAAVEDKSGSYHIDINGAPKYNKRFIETYGFYDDLAAVKDKTGWFHIHPDGTECYPSRYLWCGNFQEDLCVVKDKKNQYFHIDHNGEKTYENGYSYTGDFKDGAAVICNKDGLHTHIDYQGQLLHGNWFLGLDIFHKGQARAKDNRGWYHIDKSGQPLYLQRYAQVEPFYNGVAHAETFSGELLIINTQGQKVAQLRPELKKSWQKISSEMVGFWRTETLAIAARLHVLDSLPGSTEDVAQKIGLPSKHLWRLLRALWELGFVENKEELWHLTENGKNLVPHKDCFLSAAAIMWSDVNRIAWKNLTNIICDGKDKHHSLFKSTASDENRTIYHQAIDGYAIEDFSALLTLVDWQQHQHVIGIGRSAKILLEQALKAHKHLQALLLGEAYIFQPISINATLKSRYRLKTHELYQPWPKMADAIFLPKVLHYWPDEQAIQILQRAHDALLPHGKIYLIEMLLNEKSPDGALLDLNMLAESGGRLRTLSQWTILLKQSSLSVQQHLKITDGVDLLVLNNHIKGTSLCNQKEISLQNPV